MKSFMNVEAVSTILHLIEKVLDFKKFIDNGIVMGKNTLLGQTKEQQFKFYVDAKGCLVMEYKLLCTDDEWFPQDGGIKLWKKGSQRRALWPCGFSMTVQPLCMQNFKGMKWGFRVSLITRSIYHKRIP